ncbi:hypothetical protein RSOL_054930 [Rhizoctonia solani AG-3 Rhs1AP]|uniref:Uncharacterized protein n=2 Tax=Rhizoctonia solani AG-3 TaxID=1086053 RepID=X8IZU4_9AGAM|nr:hypothetical protein RSOL_054930 [Rhizoctonia solani AG-3 Rhs1AP]
MVAGQGALFSIRPLLGLQGLPFCPHEEVIDHTRLPFPICYLSIPWMRDFHSVGSREMDSNLIVLASR